MKDTTNADEIIDRLRIGLGAKSDTALGRQLGVGQQSVSNARIASKVPDAWIRKAAENSNLSADWLLFGEGRMYRGDNALEQGDNTSAPTAHASIVTCSRCLELYEELVQAQKRENALLKENGELKVEITTLQQRLSPPAAASVESPPAKTA